MSFRTPLRAGPSDGVAGGALEADVLNRAAKAAMEEGESMRGGLPRKIL